MVGQLSQLVNSERSMVAFRIIPIADFNEITFHHLEVIQVHLSRTRQYPICYNRSFGINFNSTTDMTEGILEETLTTTALTRLQIKTGEVDL